MRYMLMLRVGCEPDRQLQSEGGQDDPGIGERDLSGVLQGRDRWPGSQKGGQEGGFLDQICAKNIGLVESTISENFLDNISDRKCLKLTLKLQEHTSPV